MFNATVKNPSSPPSITQPENQASRLSQGYVRHFVAPDGDCGYTAIGTTRHEASRQLIHNLNRIRDIIKLPVEQALIEEEFRVYLHDTQEFDTSKSIDNEPLRKQYAINLIVQSAYIQYDVIEKKIDGGWAHPKILQALAHIDGQNLRIWVLGPDGALARHIVGDENYNTPLSLTTDKRIDLLFINGDHFDVLQFIGYENSIPDEGVCPYTPPSNSAKIITPTFTEAPSSEKENHAVTTPEKNPSILFISETRFGEKRFSDITRLTPSLIPDFPSDDEKIERQLLRSFLGTYFPRLRKERLIFSGYPEFKNWFEENKATLNTEILTQKLKKHSQKIALCDALYKELCLLAPHRKYKTSNNTLNTPESPFQLNPYVERPLTEKIEAILAIYRRRMISNTEINLALSDLILLINSPFEAKSTSKKYKHIVWNSKQKISPNIRSFLNDITDNIIELPPIEHTSEINETSKKTANISITPSKPELESGKDTSTVDDATYWAGHAEDLIDRLLSSNDATLDDFDQHILIQPEVIGTMLSNQSGVTALTKALTIEPRLVECIFHTLKSSMEKLLSFIEFVMQTAPSQFRSTTVEVLCQPENHQKFLSLLLFKPKKLVKFFWKNISQLSEEITKENKHKSILYNLLQTIDGIAVLNKLLQAARSSTAKNSLENHCNNFISKEFSASKIHFSIGIVFHTVFTRPFITLSQASKLAELEHSLENTPGKPEEIEILIATITFLAKNATTKNQWSGYKLQIYDSIIACLANYMENFPPDYWRNTEFNIPWNDLISLINSCKAHLKSKTSQYALDALFDITRFYSMQHLLDEDKLAKLHQEILQEENYGKKFFETSIDYLLSEENLYLKSLVEKTFHTDRYLVLTSIIKHADITQPSEEEFVASLLIHLTTHIRQHHSDIKAAESTSLYQTILLTLYNKQVVINTRNPHSIIRGLIAVFANLFMQKLMTSPQNDCTLYKEVWNVIQATDRSDQQSATISVHHSTFYGEPEVAASRGSYFQSGILSDVKNDNIDGSSISAIIAASQTLG